MQTVAATRQERRAAVSMTGVWLRGVRGEEPGGLIANEATRAAWLQSVGLGEARLSFPRSGNRKWAFAGATPAKRDCGRAICWSDLRVYVSNQMAVEL